MNIISKGVKGLTVMKKEAQDLVYMELYQLWELYNGDRLWRASHRRWKIYEFVTKAIIKSSEQGKSE